MILKYCSNYDSLSKFLTIAMLIIFITIGIGLSFALDKKNTVILLILIITIFIFLSLMPIQYILTEQEIIIRKLFSRKSIRIDSIITITTIQHSIPFTYSSKGFFGYLGKTMDGSISYSTSLKNNVLIKTSNGAKFIISPCKIRSFKSEIKRKMLSKL